MEILFLKCFKSKPKKGGIHSMLMYFLQVQFFKTSLSWTFNLSFYATLYLHKYRFPKLQRKKIKILKNVCNFTKKLCCFLCQVITHFARSSGQINNNYPGFHFYFIIRIYIICTWIVVIQNICVDEKQNST